MRATPFFTVQLEPMVLHPEATLGASSTRFLVPCAWVRRSPNPRVEWKSILATDLSHTVISRFVYEQANMRIDDLSDEPYATWQGVRLLRRHRPIRAAR